MSELMSAMEHHGHLPPTFIASEVNSLAELKTLGIEPWTEVAYA